MKKRYAYAVEKIEIKREENYQENGIYFAHEKETIIEQHLFATKKKAEEYYKKNNGININIYTENYYSYNKIRTIELK